MACCAQKLQLQHLDIITVKLIPVSTCYTSGWVISLIRGIFELRPLHYYTRYITYNSLPRRAAMTRHTDCHTRQQQQPGLAQRETDGAKVLPTSDQVGLYLASIHQMAPPNRMINRNRTTYAANKLLLCPLIQQQCVSGRG